MTLPSKQRPFLIIHLINALAVVFVVGTILATRIADHRPDTPEPSPPTAGVAVVHPDEEAACRALRENPPSPVSEATAMSDNAALGEKLVKSNPEVTIVSLGKCADSWVIHVGVLHTRVDVPAESPGGTPVLAYVQPRFVPF